MNIKKIDKGFLGQQMVVIPGNILMNVKQNPLVNSLYLTDIGFYPHAKHHYRKRTNGAEEYILIYCTDGKGWVTINGHKVTIKTNDFSIIPKHTSHSYGASQDDSWSIFWLHFTGSNASTLYNRFSEKNLDASLKSQIPFRKSRIESFKQTIALLEKGYSIDILEFVNMNLWNLIASFLYPIFDINSSDYQSQNSTVEKIISYMQENMDQTLTVEELANYVNYSESYFYSLFKNYTGYSPIQYFNHLKVQKACQYLSFTHLSIKEIAYKHGFEDPYYFSRLFKKLMSLSPNQYRKEYKPD